MTYALIWMASLGLGLALLGFTEAYDMYALNTLIAAGVSGNLIALGLRGLEGSLAHPIYACAKVSQALAVLAVVWGWLAISSLFLIRDVYGFMDATARVGGFATAAVLCGAVAVLTQRAGARAVGRGPDAVRSLQRLLRLNLLLALMQGMAALATAAALIGSGVMGGLRADWSANAVLLFGAVALAAIAAQAALTIDRALAVVAATLGPPGSARSPAAPIAPGFSGAPGFPVAMQHEA